MTPSVYVRAPCRLHFGMFSFGHFTGPQFGGVGVMIEPPAIEVTITTADECIIRGQLKSRVARFAELASRNWRLSGLPRCEISAISPPDHVGLGVGTQLGLAVAAGLRRYLGLPELPIEELAMSVGRGARSSVGTYGFQHGGLIVDAGKEPGQPVGKLARRVALPSAWRFVLLRPSGAQGLAGDYEADAFARLPPVREGTSRELRRLANEEMLPAIARRDCAAFGDAVYQFGRLAGDCFAAVQGGPFASPKVARLVESMREYGIPGVGQSSWGPTVFAITPDDFEANRLVHWLRASKNSADDAVTIARPNNRGAQVSTA